MPLGPGRDPVRRDRPIRTGRRDRPVIQLPSVTLRVAVMVGFAVLLFGVILFRLWFLQILSGEQFVAQANDNRLRNVKIVAPRGAILMDVPVGELDATVKRLAKVLKTKPARLRKQLVEHSHLTFAQLDRHIGPGFDLVVVKEDVGRRVVSYLLEHEQSFPGVEVQKNYLRSYPQGALAAHVLGHTGEISREQLKMKRFKGYAAGDVVGQDGVEWTYDRWLRGRDGVAKIEVDAFGRPKSHDPVPGGRLPEAGDSLVLTIDAAVQRKTDDALKYGIDLAHRDGNWAAAGAAAVVLDARTGGVVAMSSYPTFDPDVWVGGISEKDFKRLQARGANYPMLNRVIQEQKAVGSTFKVVDAVAGLEEGVIGPGTSFYCDGSYQVPISADDTTWNCWALDGHGTLDLVGALTQSCDVYFYNVGYAFYGRAGTELADWAGRLGMGKPTGVDLPGEAAGRVPTPAWRRSYFESEVDKLWTPGNSVNLAIGQGDLEATPLQLAVTYAAIANGGSIVTPHLGLKVVTAEGKLVRRLAEAKPRKLGMSRTTLDVLQRALRSAASAPTGTSAPVFAGYPVAVSGKTGTAEVFGQGDYAWYASYAPAGDPRYVVVVMIEQGGHGGSTAAPAARMIYDALFHVDGGEFTGSVRSD
jgi:penicillin-binding protein 2